MYKQPFPASSSAQKVGVGGTSISHDLPADTIDGGGEHESPAFDHTQPPTAVAPKQDTLDTLEVLAVQEGAK